MHHDAMKHAGEADDVGAVDAENLPAWKGLLVDGDRLGILGRMPGVLRNQHQPVEDDCIRVGEVRLEVASPARSAKDRVAAAFVK